MGTPFIVPEAFDASEVTVLNRRTYNSVSLEQGPDMVLMHWEQLPALIRELIRLYELEVGPLDKAL